MLTNYFEGLNSVSDAILAGFVHVHPGRNSFSALFHDSVLKHKRRDPFVLKPARDLVTFMIDGQRHKSAAGRNDDSGSRRFGFLRKVNRQRRRDNVEEDSPNRRVLYHSFLLRPTLRTRSYARPEIDYLRLDEARQ